MPPAAASSAAGKPLVTLAGVAKQFANGTLALDRFDLAIRNGEFLSLLGPSGCGKSTALRLIAGLGEPTRGDIAWSGAKSGRRRNGLDVGFVFQEPTLMPWASVFRNVILPLELEGAAHAVATERAAQALERVGLISFRDAYPRELSGGMKMRVSIARALITDPPLLLMDEPFGALDALTREQRRIDLEELWMQTGKTVLFITHSIDEAVLLADRVIVMSARPGRVEREIPIGLARPRGLAARQAPEFLAASNAITEIFLARGVLHQEAKT